MPHRRLDRAKIVSAALRLSVVTEPDAMSFRKIGAELGVDPTAVYRHFPSRSELVAATLDALWSRTVPRIPEGLEWRPRLEHIGRAFYDAIQAHPAVGVEAGHRTTGGPGELAAVQMVLEALGDAGLSPRDVVRLYPVYSGVVLSMASAQAAYELAGDELSSPSTRAWLAEHLSPDPEQFPVVHKYAGDLEQVSHRDVFDLSLEMVLDTIEAAV